MAAQEHINRSPFAAELDRRLAGDEPFSSIVVWWRDSYYAWRESMPPTGNPSTADLTENEDCVFCLDFAWALKSKFETLTEDDDDPDVQFHWNYVRQARAALQAWWAG
jgi:hypothetical protein